MKNPGTVTKAKGWPLSQDELKASKQILFPRLSFIRVLQKYSKQVEDIGTATFTNRCICPNPKHKNGHERTPSFYFSEEDKSFRCFGCGVNGDIFDLIGLMEGLPWGEVVKLFLKKEGIDLNTVDLDFSEVNVETFRQYVFDINLKLSSALREHLKTKIGTERYEEERKWIDLMFKRIDNRFDKIPEGNREAVKEFEIQVMLELERKKSKR